MTIFPPVVDYSFPAFLTNETIRFYFKFPELQNIDKSRARIQYKILYQVNNKTALSDGPISNPPSGKNWAYDDKTGKYYIDIPPYVLRRGWEVGTIYKLQLRFYFNDDEVSEWSTVCYLKATRMPILAILNEEQGRIEIRESPQFFGACALMDFSEPEKEYKFAIYSVDGTLIEDSGWQSHTSEQDYDTWTFKRILKDFTYYRITYAIRTKNGYERAISYDFLTVFSILDSFNKFHIDPVNNYDIGTIDLGIISDNEITGNLVIRRSSSESDFLVWEDLKIIQVLNKKTDIHFRDFYVKHGIVYQYGIQRINKDGYRSKMTKSKKVMCTYEDTFLFNTNKQFCVKFNPKIATYKKNIQEAKQDTVGGKYPHILRNGNMEYHSFTLNGLISYYSDEEYLFSDEKLDRDDWTIDLDNKNIYYERKFREEVEDFLTDKKAKLYKSPTEGIKLITMTGVSMTPQTSLGRLLYEFGSTVYEIDDASTIQAGIRQGVLDLGKYIRAEDMGNDYILGQWRGANLPAYYNVYTAIAREVNAELESCYRDLLYFDSIKITVPDEGRQFTINGAEITVGKSGYYELDGVIPIESLVSESPGTHVMIDYVAVVRYREKEWGDPIPDLENAEPVSELGQLHGTFSDAQGYRTRDVFKAIENKFHLIKTHSLSYLSITVTNPTTILLDGEEIVINPETGYVLKDYIIRSLEFTEPSYAEIDVVYNGFKER